MNISALTNLKELTLLSDRTSSTEISLNARQLLSQVDVTHLKTINFIIYYEEKYTQKQLDGIDAELSQEKFNNLEAISVQLMNNTYSAPPLNQRRALFQQLEPKVRVFFPLARKRKIFKMFDLYDF